MIIEYLSKPTCNNRWRTLYPIQKQGIIDNEVIDNPFYQSKKKENIIIQ
jgi:hypothetical protein